MKIPKKTGKLHLILALLFQNIALAKNNLKMFLSFIDVSEA